MLGKDIEVGKAYVYKSYRWSGGQKFLVDRVEKTKVPQRNSFRQMREATFYHGWLYPEGKGKRWEARVEARELHGLWEPYAAEMKAQAEYAAKVAAEAQQARLERKPKALALEALLVEAGVAKDHHSWYYRDENVMGDNRDSTFNIHEVVNEGKDVEIDLDDLLLLVEHARQEGYLQAQMNFSTEV